MITHQLKLATEPFEAIVSGKKTIESRLYDEKRLFIHNNPAKFGGESVKWLEKQIGEFYSLSDQLENGVIGIEFEIF